jgi:hypothetical protein
VGHEVYKLPKSKKRKPRALMKFAAGWSPSGYTLDVPVYTQTESNAKEHWRTRHGRAKAQRALTMMALDMLPNPEARTRITWVSFQRFAPGELDCDNLPGSCKHVRDQVAAWIGGENTVTGEGDDSPRCGIVWEYTQTKSKMYGVRINMSFVP